MGNILPLTEERLELAHEILVSRKELREKIAVINKDGDWNDKRFVLIEHAHNHRPSADKIELEMDDYKELQNFLVDLWRKKIEVYERQLKDIGVVIE